MLIAGLEFPGGLCYLVEHDVWARLEGDGTATVGITALGIRMAGDIYMCRPKGVGVEVRQGQGIAVVELAKSIVSVKSAVSGTVAEVNGLLADTPEWVHREPYGRGWLARLRLADEAADRVALVQGEAAARALAHQAWLHGVAPGDAP